MSNSSNFTFITAFYELSNLKDRENVDIHKYNENFIKLVNRFSYSIVSR